MGIHYVVAKALMADPERYAKMLSTGNENCPGEQAFRGSPNSKTLKTMLVETLDSYSSVAKDDSEDNKRKLLINLLSDVDSEQSEGEKPLQSSEGEQEHRRRRKGKTKHKKRRESVETDSKSVF